MPSMLLVMYTVMICLEVDLIRARDACGVKYANDYCEAHPLSC